MTTSNPQVSIGYQQGVEALGDAGVIICDHDDKAITTDRYLECVPGRRVAVAGGRTSLRHVDPGVSP